MSYQRSNRSFLSSCFYLLAAAAVLSSLAFVQPASAQVRWRSGVTDTPKMQPGAIQQVIVDLAGREGGAHAVVKLDRPVDARLRARLERSGLRLLNYLGDNAFFAAVSPAAANAVGPANVGALQSVQPVERAWKLHPMLLAGETPEWAVVDNQDPDNPVVGAYVLLHRDVRLNPTGVDTAVRHGATVRSQLESINGLVIELPMDNIPALADEDIVQWIEPPLPRMSEVNNSNRARVGADTVQQPPYGLDGSGVTVLVYDAGTARATHVDFGGRCTVRDGSGMHYHSTHVAGTVGGSGLASGGTYKGMAPGVTIESYGFEYDGSGIFLYTNPGDIESDYNQAINVYGADIANNSIGSNTESNGFPCSIQGDYGVTAALIDAIVGGSLGAPFRIVWAAGNERQGSRCDVEGYGDYYSTAPPACAKNQVSVGAMNSNDDSMTYFTSWGPTDDGRLKPDISAPGCQSNDDNGVTSCDSSSNTAYTTLCGTSMASPTVCGLGALLLQDYRAHYPGEPDFRNSTLKALLAHTAVDLQNPGPDYMTGYGSVRIQPAVDQMRAGNFLENEVDQGETFQVLAIVNPGDGALKVTLAWDDPPATPNVIPSLVDDLDLRVFDAGDNRLYPWTLNPLNPSANAVRTAEDHLNNIEQVYLSGAAPGAYRIEVYGYNVPQGPQPFSLVATPELVACSPLGVLNLDRTRYRCDSTVTLQVVDCDLNTDSDLVETVDVTFASDSEPAGETVTLTETGPETAVFRGDMGLSSVNSPGVLLVAHGDTVTATYIDADNGMGGTNVEVIDTATIDCVAPNVINVQVSNVQPRSAAVSFNTNEPAITSLRYGLSCDSLVWSATVSDDFTIFHDVSLTGLLDNTTYYFVVDAEDSVGNVGTNDNGGVCFTFTTPDVPDYFTEQFTTNNDLDDRSILFVPNQTIDYYRACTYSITQLPTDPAGGTNLQLGDDSYTPVNLTAGETVSLYGVAYDTVYVGSNGYVTFGSGDSDRSESLADHFDRPRVSALFDDLNPYIAGSVSYQQLEDRLAVTWLNLPEYYNIGSNTCQVEMFFDGRIRLSYLSISAADGLVGLSEGNGVPVNLYQDDFTSLAACPTGGCPGDLNGDGFRNVSDFTLFAAAYGSQLGDPNYSPAADMDGNGFINVSDFTLFAAVFGVPCP
jgi:hypothetical protein